MNWKQILTKVRGMDRQELLFRGRQELGKRSDRMLARLGHDFAKDAQTTARIQPGSFFFRPEQVETLLQIIRERLPEQVSRIVERADKVCSHRFDLLGYTGLNYGKEINWHLDAVHEKIAPQKPFYRVRYLEFSEVGDSKVIWELNRHQHFVVLAKAFRITGDERFAREIFLQWRSWHLQNPYPTGINWASSLEVAFRSLSWIWTRVLLQGTKFLSDEFEAEYLSAQALNGRHIERYLSTYFSPNTHLLGEAVGLFFIGTMCPELRDAERWKTLGWRMVLEQLQKQVNQDGMHFEQSVYYHVYAVDLFLHAAMLASANGVHLPEQFEHMIERMMNALYLLGRAGPPLRFGDDDGGRLFDASRNRDEHLLDPLAAGAILFGRGEFKSLCRELREETIWLTGEQGVARWDALEPKPTELGSAALAASGIYLLASPEAQSQVIVKSGPTVPQTRGHAHADALSVCLQSGGQNLLIDAGTHEYVGDGGKRNLYRGTAMHNTIVVDGQDQSEPDGPFSWKQELPARNERWISGETFTLLVGSHKGYSRLPETVKHHRWVVTLKSSMFLVRDVLSGEGRHRLELSWRLSPDLQLQPNDVFRLRQSSRGLGLLTAREHGWSEEVYKGPWSPVYGSQRMTMVLKFATTRGLPVEFVTLLVPLSDANDAPGKLFRVQTPENSAASAYRHESGEVIHQFFFAKSGQRWNVGRVTSDAEFVCLTSSHGDLKEAIFCQGSYVELEGKRIASAAHVVSYFELIEGDPVQVFCSDPKAIMMPELSNSPTH